MTLNDQPNDRQEALEARMVSLGQQRYNRQLAMPWKEGDHQASLIDEADMAPGASLIRRYTGQYTAFVTEAVNRVYEGRAGRYARTVQARLEGIEPHAMALIALRRTLSGASGDENMLSLCVGIGSMVEEHVAITALRSEELKLANWWERKAKATSNSRHARKVMRAAARDQLNATDWTKEEKVKVGAFLLEILEDQMGLVERATLTKGKRTIDIVQCTPVLREWLDDMHEKCALMQPVRLPMLCKPLDWTTPWDGGYLTVDTKIMKNASRPVLDDLASADIREVYSAINRLQAVRWTINQPVLEVLRALRDAPAGAPCIPDGSPLDIPSRPAGIPSDVPISDLSAAQQAELKVWRAKATAAHGANAKRMSQRVAFAQKVWVAEEFAGEPVIYFPWQIDTRGRGYTIPTEVSPQSDDLGKSLLRFADRKPLGETGAYWLAVHVANSWGEDDGQGRKTDKLTFDERVQWVLDNEDMILDIGISPADSVNLWAGADCPWQFMAACLEWSGYVLSGRADDYESALPVAMDGSCSGLQHFSAVLRDPLGGRAVNLTPTGTVEDIYGEVRTRVNLRLNAPTCEGDLQQWRGFVDRKIVKQPCMTYAYSATVTGMRGQIVKALEDRAPVTRPPLDPYQAGVVLAPVVRQCIEEVVVAAAGAMQWLQEVANVMTSHGLDLRWTAANGLPVRQSERKLRVQRLSVWYSGVRYKPQLQEDTQVLDKIGQKSAFSPNWIHSQDAAHLMAVVNTGAKYGLENWAMVHDSFGVHACDVELMNEVIRETFIAQYEVNRLEELRDELLDQLPVGAELPPLPPTGTLDLGSVRDSEYFFA